MTDRICTVPGCPKPYKAKGYCATHYARLRKTGEPGPAESLKLPKPLTECSVPKCESLVRSSGSVYCEMHYGRVRRTGDLEAQRRWRVSGGPCSVEGCEESDRDIGMCMKHATRMRRHGDPTVFIAPEARKKLVGPENPAWIGEDVSYAGAHGRVRLAKGSASNYLCTDCGVDAAQWSYDRLDPDERQDEKGPYSTDPSHYVPRCVPCHKQFDLDAIDGRAEEWQLDRASSLTGAQFLSWRQSSRAAEILRQACSASGRTQRDIARECGWNQSTLWHKITGESRLRAAEALRLAEVLHVSAAELGLEAAA
jgi:hypothetical protein